MILDHIRTYALTQSTITAITGRIYGVILPQDPVYPCVTMREESSDVYQTLSQQTTAAWTPIMIDAWHTELSAAYTLANAIRTVFKNFSGTADSIRIIRTNLIQGPQAFYEDSVFAYRVTQTFNFYHGEG